MRIAFVNFTSTYSLNVFLAYAFDKWETYLHLQNYKRIRTWRSSNMFALWLCKTISANAYVHCMYHFQFHFGIFHSRQIDVWHERLTKNKRICTPDHLSGHVRSDNGPHQGQYIFLTIKFRIISNNSAWCRFLDWYFVHRLRKPLRTTFLAM